MSARRTKDRLEVVRLSRPGLLGTGAACRAANAPRKSHIEEMMISRTVRVTINLINPELFVMGAITPRESAIAKTRGGSGPKFYFNFGQYCFDGFDTSGEESDKYFSLICPKYCAITKRVQVGCRRPLIALVAWQNRPFHSTLSQ